MTRLRLLLASDAVGGVWVYSLELARALRPLGIETILAVLGPPPSASQRGEAAGVRLIDTGLPLDWVDTSPAQMRRAAEEIRELARRLSVDLVQTSSAALLANTRFDQPCIAVQHSCVASWWAAVKGTPLPSDFAWRRGLVEAGLNNAAAIVAPSEAFAAQTARLYKVSAPVVAVHNGRRPLVTAPSSRADFVFTAGRLWDEGKNAATLDRAAARLRVPVQAAGPTNGPNGTTVELRFAQRLGELSGTRIAGLLGRRPIFASAALYEPFGLSVLEAAQAGCALVLSDIPTHRELWGGAAIFVQPLDDTAFARTVEDLLDNPEERNKRGELARACADLYTPERMARGMAEVYARVTNDRAPPTKWAGAA